MQQRGEAFDDFIVALRELVKTCNFCSPACAAKSIRDQIIEGILDGDTIEHLLQQQNLTLDKAITMCRAEEPLKSNAQTSLFHRTILSLQFANNQPRNDHPSNSILRCAQVVEVDHVKEGVASVELTT